MTIFRTCVSAVALAIIASGCASTQPTTTTEPARSELVYRTGSNIPIRDAKPLTKEEKDRQAEDAQRMLTRPVGPGVPLKN